MGIKITNVIFMPLGGLDRRRVCPRHGVRGMRTRLRPRRWSVDRALLTSAAPYRQNKTERLKGCQIDLVIQTKKSVYCVEIKRQNSIGEKVVDECEEKISRLKVKNTRTVRPVLVYDGDLSRRVPADAYFSFIVSSDDLIGRSIATGKW